MADRIELQGLQAFGYHGVFPEEKRQGQLFLADIVCWADLRQAAASDDLTHTINYAELADIAVKVMTGPSKDLIETVAGTIADEIMDTYPMILAVEVSIHKPQAPIPHQFANVKVVARRSRKRCGND